MSELTRKESTGTRSPASRPASLPLRAELENYSSRSGDGPRMLRRCREIVEHGIELLENRKMLTGNILVTVGITKTNSADELAHGVEITKLTAAN
jgi:hypothetical protein